MAYVNGIELVCYEGFDMIRPKTHLLIAGASGSGKSVILSGILQATIWHPPVENKLILIDPKRVELSIFKRAPHCIKYASEPGDMVNALHYGMELIEKRYTEMQRKKQRKYEGAAVYIVIDELADLMTTNKKEVQPLLQRICQIGRAANVHVIACTQCPLSTVIPTAIKVNFDEILGLRTATAQHSRNIIGQKGLETLPQYGQAIYKSPTTSAHLKNTPMVSDDLINATIDYWKHPAKAEKKSGLLKGLFTWLYQPQTQKETS